MEMEMEGTADRSVLSQLLLVMQRQQTEHKTSREICRERMETTTTPPKNPSNPIPEGSSTRIANTPSFAWEVGNLMPGRGKHYP